MKYIAILAVFICQTSGGQSPSDNLGDVVISQSPRGIVVGDDWSPQFMKKMYGGQPKGTTQVLGIVFNQTPASALQFLEERNSDFSKKAGLIAGECKRRNEKSIWDQIGCVSQSVNATLKKYSWPDTSTFCRAHAQAFVETFRQLGIPRSQAFQWDASTEEKGGHVVNRLTLTDRNGRYFSYVIDVGWKPDHIFPLAENTKDFHLKAGRELPEVSTDEPQFKFQAQCGSERSAVGKLSESFKSIWQLINNK